jgi:hypothetical protein
VTAGDKTVFEHANVIISQPFPVTFRFFNQLEVWSSSCSLAPRGVPQ